MPGQSNMFVSRNLAWSAREHEANGLAYSKCPANTNDLATPLSNGQLCIDLPNQSHVPGYIPECMNRVNLCTIDCHNKLFPWQKQTIAIQPSLHIPYLQFRQLPQSCFSWQPIHLPQLGRLVIFGFFGSLAPSSCGWLRFVPWSVAM